MKLKPYSKTWERKANSLARSFCPSIYACKKCNYPVVSGYICGHCKDPSPSTTVEEDKEFNKS